MMLVWGPHFQNCCCTQWGFCLLLRLLFIPCPCSRRLLQPGCQQHPWEWRMEEGRKCIHLFILLGSLLCLSILFLCSLFLTKTYVISVYAKCFWGTTEHTMIRTVHFMKNHISTINYPFSDILCASIRTHSASWAGNPNLVLHFLLSLTFYIHQVRKSSNTFPSSTLPLISHVSEWLSIQPFNPSSTLPDTTNQPDPLSSHIQTSLFPAKKYPSKGS